MNPRQMLAEVVAPDEAGAQRRAWESVRAAHRQRLAVRRRRRRRALLLPLPAVLVAAAALTPAGATVRHWIGRALGVPRPAPMRLALPAPGTLLVSGSRGTWTVARGGATRRLGSWPVAAWSPHARYVAVAGAGGMEAITPTGGLQWTLARRAVSGLAWYGPSGYRVAYRSGATLRVVAGDGTGDHALAADTAPVAPAWRPGHPYELVYATGGGRLVVRDADTGAVAWSRPERLGRPLSLTWSSDGGRLLLVARWGAELYDARGRPLETLHAAPRAGALSPDGRRIALVLTGGVVLAGPDRRWVLASAGLDGVTFSPDGRWLLVTSPAAGEWIFVRIAGRPRLLAVHHVAQRFGAGAGVRGWCCTATG
jgi:WD40-like Beta Propeller Repeat